MLYSTLKVCLGIAIGLAKDTDVVDMASADAVDTVDAVEAVDSVDAVAAVDSADIITDQDDQKPGGDEDNDDIPDVDDPAIPEIAESEEQVEEEVVEPEDLGCNYFLDSMGMHPIGICTGTKFNKVGKLAGETDRSVLYTCSHDNTHVIRYQFIESATCNGDYESSIATNDAEKFVCGAPETCPYVVSTEHTLHGKMTGEVEKWSSMAHVTNKCAHGKVFTCHDNTAYSIITYGDESCDRKGRSVSVEEEWVTATDEPSNADYAYREVFCNQPDPLLTMLSMPNDIVSIAVETAICLDGRVTGNHREIGKEMVSYCFQEYDIHGKPVYKGEFGEIRWTPLAGTLGPAYGLFLYGTDDDPADGFPIAYCFSGNTNDLKVCDGEWFVEHGTSPRYYKEATMKVSECECTVDEEYFSLHYPGWVEEARPQPPAEEDEEPVEAEATSGGSNGASRWVFGGVVVGLVALLR